MIQADSGFGFEKRSNNKAKKLFFIYDMLHTCYKSSKTGFERFDNLRRLRKPVAK
jgi:hypothetical protein